MKTDTAATLGFSVGRRGLGERDGVEFIRRLLGVTAFPARNLGGNFARRKKRQDDLNYYDVSSRQN